MKKTREVSDVLRRGGAGSICALVGHWATLVDSLLLMSWDNISVKSSTEPPGGFGPYVFGFIFIYIIGCSCPVNYPPPKYWLKGSEFGKYVFQIF
jgi:hypothetical protein